jgi:hypothetical protein
MGLYRVVVLWDYIVLLELFRCIRKIAQSDYYRRHVSPSVCPHEQLGPQSEGFSLNLIFEYFFQNLSRKLKFH